MKQFIDPYSYDELIYNGPGKNVYRATTNINCHDYDFVRGIRPTKGTLNTVQNLLWKKLVETLKSHGITDISHTTEFELFIANLDFVDGRPGVQRGTASRTLPETAVGNDGRRASDVGSQPADVKNILTKSKSGNRKKENQSAK